MLSGIIATNLNLNKPSEDIATSYDQVSSVVATPEPKVQETIQKLTLEEPLPWPTYGYAAYSVPKDNLVATSSTEEQQVPIASLAKIITAITILDKKPLQLNQQGPLITMTESDVALVGEYARKSGTTVPVLVGEEISQYQALQAILMVSSNNMADSLAIWAFGSMENYIEYANNLMDELGLESTIVADDASGYSPNTVSTASDIAKLGYVFMKNPVLREITMQSNATIPVAGLINNNNDYFNKPGVYGIKFGYTDEAGKCFVVASIRKTADNEEELSVSAVLGADSFNAAATDAEVILNAGNRGHDALVLNR